MEQEKAEGISGEGERRNDFEREREKGGLRKQSHSHHMQLTPASVDTINIP